MSKLRDQIQHDAWPAILASRFAREIGLPVGNLWEPGIARHLQEARTAGYSDAEIEAAFRLRLGLA